MIFRANWGRGFRGFSQMNTDTVIGIVIISIIVIVILILITIVIVRSLKFKPKATC